MLSAAVLISSSTSSYVAPVVGPRMQNAVARANAPAMDETILEKALAGELEEEGAENVFMSELGWATYLDQNAGSSYNMNERPSIAQDGYFTADIFSGPGDGTQRWQLDGFFHCTPLSLFLARCCALGSAAEPPKSRSGYATSARAHAAHTPPDVCLTIASPLPRALAVIGDWLACLGRYASEPLATAFPTITNDPNDLRSYPKGANEVNARTIKPKVKDFDPNKRITGIPGFNFFGSPSSKQEDLF